MNNTDPFTVIIGGKAGQGIKKTGSVIAQLFAGKGRHVFEMEDYQSLIRGGHNFAAISTATRPITSHSMKADLAILFDKRSYAIHKDHVAENGILIYDKSTVKDATGIGIPLTEKSKRFSRPELRMGVGAVAILAASIGLELDELVSFIDEAYPKDPENTAFAREIYKDAIPLFDKSFTLEPGDRRRPMLSGNEAIALGAAAAGLDIFYAYPMTPASSILHFFARHGKKLGVVSVHPENEIAVVNMAIGSTFAGARTMVASSGGGFALMEEGFSLAGMVESPLLCVLSSRPGPSTGVPTYTEQADLRFAIGQGHGDFPRVIASPGSIAEAFHLAAEMLQLVWKFQTPGILLTEKHISESRITVDIDPKTAQWAEPAVHSKGPYLRYLDTEAGISPLLFPPSTEFIRWNSYEHTEEGITTEKAEEIAAMHDKRSRKTTSLQEHLKTIRTVNRYGDTGPVIFTYGSTTMSVLEALQMGDITATVVQPVYLEPLPVWELTQYRNGPVIVVEQSVSGQFASLIKEKAGIARTKLISKYDGRPFDPQQLSEELKEVISGG